MHPPVVKTLPYIRNPQDWFEEFLRYPFPLLLDSANSLIARGRYDILCADPSYLITLSAQTLTVTDRNGKSEIVSDLARTMRALLAELKSTGHQLDTNWPFTGGLAGFVGYEYGRHCEGLKPRIDHTSAVPDLVIGLYRWAVVIDHASASAALVSHNAYPSACEQAILERIGRGKQCVEAHFELTSVWRNNFNRSRYGQAFRRAIDYIRAGDCYQINLAQRSSSEFKGDSWGAYTRLRQSLQAPYSAYFAGTDWSVLSFSPESFIDASGTHVRTSPIKGTRRRGLSKNEDEELRQELVTSAKDRAENLMIVDLLRNDLGKTCRPGSVRVDRLWALESYSNVHHLVSTVTGEIRSEYDPLDTFLSCFPGGSITGAPKHRAMQIIDELEPDPRSVYCGSLFYLNHNGRLASNIAIRTLVCDQHRIHCWAGGGIVADSDEEDEYQECHAKVAAILTGLEG